jgi:Core-2/I-Branching enzyme
MKQGILITAFKNFDHLMEIAQFFDDNFALYIHIDKKSKPSSSVIETLRSLSNVARVTQKYTVNWGGRNHLKSILYLISESLKDPEIEYFHLITGQDFPMKKKTEFVRFFQKNRDKDYLEHFTMPATCWNNGGMDRIEYYNFYDVFNAVRSIRIIINLRKIQSGLGIRRSISKKLPHLYGGSTYWSLSRPTIEYVHNYTLKEPRLLKRLKHTFCAEEIYLQTVVMNSPFSQRVLSNNLRFIVWEEGHGSSPGILDEGYLPAIEKSDAFFARKFDSPVSQRLLRDLKERYAETSE